MKKPAILSFVFFISLTAFRLVSETLFYVPQNWPQPEYDFSHNPLTDSKVELGRALFYDASLSANNKISCESCHSQFTAFAHVDHPLSHGINDSIGTRNAPALMNLAWQKLFMQDGAINHLDVQALAPISHPDEMGEKIENVVAKLQKGSIYPKLFYKAFGDSLITGEHLLKSLSQFMLTLISANSKYDQVKRKEAEFTGQEQKGYLLFQRHCNSCHEEPLLTTGEFANIGLPGDSLLKDWGRMKVTRNPADSLKFKIPGLRNIEFSYPYMHDGRFKTLFEVVNHYTDGIIPGKTLAPELFNPIQLSPNEKVDLIAFLLTLTDKDFLFNPDFSYPRHIFSK